MKSPQRTVEPGRTCRRSLLGISVLLSSVLIALWSVGVRADGPVGPPSLIGPPSSAPRFSQVPGYVIPPSGSLTVGPGTVVDPFASAVTAPSIAANPPASAPLQVATGSRTITLADNGQTVAVAVGTQVVVALDGGQEWAVQVDDAGVLSVVADAALPAGTQAVYVAAQPGQTTITVINDPPCAHTYPRCLMPSLLFQVQIIAV